MYPNWNSPHPPYQANNSRETNEMTLVLQRLASLEDRLERLILSIEKTNQTLHDIEELQNRVCTTGGGGAVIVRM
jgi:hypothetical protein